MNAIVQFQPASAVPAPVAAAFTFSDMERVALAIAKGGLFGSSDPNAVLTLCMLAHAEGQHPAVVFRDYHIISGKPAKKSEAMQRDFLAAGGKIEWHKLEDDCVDATFSHPQGGSVRISWDNARVAQAQLGGNAMHKKYPRQMKKARVIAEGVRTVFPMATSGLYETGEVQDMTVQDRPAAVVTPEPQRARDMGDAGRAKAETWVRDQIEAVMNADDLDALDLVMSNGHKAVAKLAREHADLHGEVQKAYEARSAELNGFTTPDNPNAGEKRGDEEMGEAGE
ncbi:MULTISPECIES: hypothetical protein [Sphingomonas]|uniref:hypothetical protein n=1 Tax=Sphingomonas TaxID=13687 RepID=UPI00254E72A3|nr:MULTISPECIES: hypothetical protein [Sphingomonas]MDK8188406.1 hypothetical protein [Sphingomonas zeae]MDK8217827.1 hypothetical protein [Sphingomonas sp. UMB7805-LC452B]